MVRDFGQGIRKMTLALTFCPRLLSPLRRSAKALRLIGADSSSVLFS